MKQHTSLEDERRALLDQIHSSREVYRRMLTQSDKPEHKTVEGNIVDVSRAERFPRSMTMRWIVQHPYMSAAAVVAVALMGSSSARTAIIQRTSWATHRLQGKSATMATMRPALSNESAGTRRTARTRSTDFPLHTNASKPMAIARSVFTGLATAAAMILRDPRKMRAASNAFSAAAGFVRSRRLRRPEKRRAQVVSVKKDSRPSS
ncbi:MAG: hypothetical protein A3I66_22285 [Burkholderiales bacterium RIFCSPLOWO2_02_FULL_57_36]|nr:MAG: hypothetical protein A3I66_22285 [Burkholderiales bacterium RIFCSPLOWO2_02_FULL_57_36]